MTSSCALKRPRKKNVSVNLFFFLVLSVYPSDSDMTVARQKNKIKIFAHFSENGFKLSEAMFLGLLKRQFAGAISLYGG